MSFVAATALTSGAQVGQAVVSLVFTVLLARALGPSQRGAFALALAVPGIIAVAVQGGLASALAFVTAKNEHPAPALAGASIVLGAGVAIMSTAIGLVYLAMTGWSPFADVETAVLVAGVATLLTSVPLAILPGFVLGRERYAAYSVVTSATGIVGLAAATVAVIVVGTGVFGALVATTLASAALVVALAVFIKRDVGLTLRPPPGLYRRLAGYGGLSQLGDALGYLNYRADLVIIGVLLSPSEVGLYAVGVALVERLWLLSRGASTVLFARASADDTGSEALTGLVARTTLWINLLASGVLFVAARPVIRLLFGSEFVAAAEATRVLLLGVSAVAVARVFANAIAAKGRPGVNLAIVAVAAAVNIVLNIYLVPRHGIAGAALASTASYSLMLIELPVYARLTRTRTRDLLRPRRSDLQAYTRTLSALLRRRSATQGE